MGDSTKTSFGVLCRFFIPLQQIFISPHDHTWGPHQPHRVRRCPLCSPLVCPTCCPLHIPICPRCPPPRLLPTRAFHFINMVHQQRVSPTDGSIVSFICFPINNVHLISVTLAHMFTCTHQALPTLLCLSYEIDQTLIIDNQERI